MTDIDVAITIYHRDASELAALHDGLSSEVIWNLSPAARRLNQSEKRNRLPSAAALARVREPILAWWQTAWNADAALADRFWAEAKAALPIDAYALYEAACAGLEWRRLRISQDQQAPEWAGHGAVP